MLYFDDIKFLNLDYIFNRIFKIITNLPEYLSYALFFWLNFIGSPWAKFLLWIITVFLSSVLFYSLYKIWEINRRDWEKYVAIFAIESEEKMEKKMIDARWTDILGHLETANPSNWITAIIESDKILDELLMERGYTGANLGERLKSIPSGKLKNVNEAWEAHKIRNKIAHESGYVLEKRDAKKAISYYEVVFKELGFLN